MVRFRIRNLDNSPELPELRVDTDPMEQRAKECADVLIKAYISGKDPITGSELSEELRVAVAPFAIQRFGEAVERQFEIRRDAADSFFGFREEHGK